jgi:L-serine dehydratase
MHCINRNGFSAIKAAAAAILALKGDRQSFIPFDNFVKTMRQTGISMNTEYKETSTGRLAVNLPEC